MAEDGDGLAKALALLDRFFNLGRLETSGAGPAEIERYYRTNRLAYTLFHSRANLLHMGLSFDGTFKEDDFFEQSRHVARLIGNADVDCLELAAGRAANSAWLAKACPGSRFTALDISDVQIGYARRAAGEVTSLSVLKGDYHDLSRFADASIDLAFIVEALCYSQRKEAVFREVARILKPGGRFLVYDGYGEPPIAARSSDEARAARLLERGMAVDHFETFEDVRDAAESAGLDLAADQDFSAAILPTCDRFARRARRFLRHRLIAWIALRAFPPAFTNNVVVGLLFPILMRRRIFTYRASLFRKPSLKEDRTRS